MTGSLGYTLYRLTSGWGQPGPAGTQAERPSGPLVWCLAESESARSGLMELTAALVAERPEIHIVASFPGDTVAGATVTPAPQDIPSSVRAFLAHWRPDVIVMLGAPARPVLVEEAHALGLPLFLFDAHAPDLGALRWLPGLGRTLYQRFRRIIARDPEAAAAIIRRGAFAERVDSLGRLEQSNNAMPHNEAERAAFALQLRTRPVWLAAALPLAEESAVIDAHRQAMKLAHRLLLILVPEDPGRGDALAAEIEANGSNWIVARRSAEDDPTDDVQVYIADTEGEMGLWYRIAPITYMGGSLSAGGSRRTPFEPAALGSAVIHGTAFGDHEDAFRRLGRLRATRPLRGPGDLGDAVGDLLAPDRSALLAHAAWAEVSASAEVSDAVTRLIFAALDEKAAA